MKTKPNISKMGFWDVHFDNLDFDKRKDFIIVRVFERGDMNDINEIMKYYDKDTIKKALTSETFLLSRAVKMSQQLLHIKSEEFQCLKQTPRLLYCMGF